MSPLSKDETGYSGFYSYSPSPSPSSYLYIGAVIVSIGVPILNALILSWIRNNVAGRTKRLIVIALGVTVTAIAGILCGQIYRASDQDVHNQHHWITLTILSLTFIVVLLLQFGLEYENKQRTNRIPSQIQVVTVNNQTSTRLDKVNFVCFFQ